MRKRIMAGIASGFFIVGALASPAAAGGGHDHDDPEDCPYNAVCFWEHKHFEGDMSIRWNPGTECDKAPDGKIGSVVNNLHQDVWLYSDWDCDNVTEVVEAHSWDAKVHAHSWI
ncbi:peptidase inhibitor family I36 protein [Glycomyces sp. TRM65418]|uniref:peptidase inhibitor family I36 protein n=1 Tax=Glycomyces sp. TRM65418 TaxID=2867006 RepID=UPI001CE608D1|nr:peptidase inhibitor family I36 protein [Glycomyces sp. TRM65418]MCC3763560.1 peptidase inhibitor family I36 protein [Glycomyces sp. TRM65418]QZD57544.1 peptidase inhibitor family I36 protein [Glycomyces sp. TRM65418]